MTFKRACNETFTNFEEMLVSILNKSQSHDDTVKIPESLTSFLLLCNANIDGSQYVTVLRSMESDCGNITTGK